MNNLPLLSPVIFNAGKVLEQAMLSAINQICPRVEYIIVDGNSSDNTNFWKIRKN
jgi:glycosyltransferase involved in cell wall biosynthesis